MILAADLSEKISGGIPGLIMGALIGVVAGAVLEDVIKDRGRRTGKYFKKLLSRDKTTISHDTFRWGPMITPLLVFEGDGEHVIDEQSVYLIVDKAEVELPDELQEWKNEIEQEQLRRRRRGESHFRNVVVTRSPT